MKWISQWIRLWGSFRNQSARAALSSWSAGLLLVLVLATPMPAFSEAIDPEIDAEAIEEPATDAMYLEWDSDPEVEAAGTHVDVPAPVSEWALENRLIIEGDDEFCDTIRAALGSIDSVPDARWSALVSENLWGVRPAVPNQLPAGAFAGMLATASGGIALFDSTRADLPYIASVIVHEAWHYKQFAARRAYHGPIAEIEAMELQAEFLAQIAPEHPGIPYLYGLVAQMPVAVAR